MLKSLYGKMRVTPPPTYKRLLRINLCVMIGMMLMQWSSLASATQLPRGMENAPVSFMTQAGERSNYQCGWEQARRGRTFSCHAVVAEVDKIPLAVMGSITEIVPAKDPPVRLMPERITDTSDEGFIVLAIGDNAETLRLLALQQDNDFLKLSLAPYKGRISLGVFHRLEHAVRRQLMANRQGIVSTVVDRSAGLLPNVPEAAQSATSQPSIPLVPPVTISLLKPSMPPAPAIVDVVPTGEFLVVTQATSSTIVSELITLEIQFTTIDHPDYVELLSLGRYGNVDDAMARLAEMKALGVECELVGWGHKTPLASITL